MEQQVTEGLSFLTRAAATLDSPQSIPANSPKMGNASQKILPLENCHIPRTDSHQKNPTKSLTHYLRRKKSIHPSTPAHIVSLTTHEHDKHQSQQIIMSGTHADSGSLSSYSGNEAYWEGMPRSAAKALIQFTALPSEDALIILHSLVDQVAEKSAFSSTHAKLKLLRTHKAIWTKLAQELGISPSIFVTYTYNYLFNPSLVEMAEEVIVERNQGVFIDVSQLDSAPTQMTLVSRIRKSAASGSKPNSPAQKFHFDAMWREETTNMDVVLWITTPTIHPLAVEEFLTQSLYPASSIIYTKIETKLTILK